MTGLDLALGALVLALAWGVKQWAEYAVDKRRRRQAIHDATMFRREFDITEKPRWVR